MKLGTTVLCAAYLPELDAVCELPIHGVKVEHQARNHPIEDVGLWDVFWQGEVAEPGA